MADDNIIINGYSRQALQQLEESFRRAGGGSSNNNGSGSSNPTGDNGDAVDDNTDAINDQTSAYGGLTQATDRLEDAMGSIRNVVGSRGLGMLLGEFQSGLVGGVETLGSFDDYLKRSIDSFVDLGVSVEELQTFNAQARAASINLGGFSAWSDKLETQQEHYFARFGSYTDALEHQTVMMDTLTHSGTDANALYGRFGKALDATNDDLLKLGVGYKESREHLVSMTQDENVRQRLLSATNEKRRKQIMLEVQSRFKNLKAMGMTTEQAIAASKALEALTGKGPLDRFKQAAKMQAGMSALGIENAAEVASIIRKGDRASEAERAIVAKAQGRIENIAAEARTQGIGREFTVSTIMTKTGLDDISKVFSTKLDAGAAVSQKQLDAIQIIGKDTPKITQAVGVIAKVQTGLEKSWVLEVPQMAADVATAGIKLLAAAPMIASISGATLAGLDAMKAVNTGQSSSWTAVTNAFPVASEKFSNGVGWFVDSVRAFGGNAEAKKRLQQAEDQLLEEQKKQAKMDKQEELLTVFKGVELSQKELARIQADSLRVMQDSQKTQLESNQLLTQANETAAETAKHTKKEKVFGDKSGRDQ